MHRSLHLWVLNLDGYTERRLSGPLWIMLSTALVDRNQQAIPTLSITGMTRAVAQSSPSKRFALPPMIAMMSSSVRHGMSSCRSW